MYNRNYIVKTIYFTESNQTIKTQRLLKKKINWCNIEFFRNIILEHCYITMGTQQLVWFYNTSILVGYLMPNPLYYIYIRYIWFGLDRFYSISTIVGYLMPNPLYTYILNIYDLVWLGFRAYQPLLVIQC